MSSLLDFCVDGLQKKVWLNILFDVGNHIANGVELLCIGIRYVNLKGLLQLHHQLYGVERVSTQVSSESSLWHHLRRLHTQLLAHDCHNFISNLRHIFRFDILLLVNSYIVKPFTIGLQSYTIFFKTIKIVEFSITEKGKVAWKQPAYMLYELELIIVNITPPSCGDLP